MNSENLSLFICCSIYNYTSRDERGPIRTVLTDVTYLCLEEKITILQANPAKTLNQRTELVSKCRHIAKYEPKNHQRIETTFNANRLITET